MIARVFALARAPKGRLTLAALLAALTIVFGVGLMSTAGYLISRAAEEPAVLSLTVAIVGVRFFALGRPVVRYLERLASHDLAFRALGRVRVQVYDRLEPLAPAELEGYRRGDLLSRVVADVDALQVLYLRGVVPAIAAVLAGCVSVAVAAAILPSAGVVLAVGLALAGIGVPLAAGRRIVELTDREAAVRDPAEPAELAVGPVPVSLEAVRARYEPDDAPALDGVTLRIEPGQRMAVVGPSGVGKSTIVNLLLRFLDPECGRVTIGGRDLRELRQEDVRRAVAVAGQESHLFSTSIRENLRLARPDAGDAELEGALRRARIWDWVASLPDGLDTLVGEQGRELSGGQRGRLVVARALLADAPVLVLDEPTAHLDSDTATSLLDDVLDNAGDASILLITHRRERLDRMDEVVELSG